MLYLRNRGLELATNTSKQLIMAKACRDCERLVRAFKEACTKQESRTSNSTNKPKDTNREEMHAEECIKKESGTYNSTNSNIKYTSKTKQQDSFCKVDMLCGSGRREGGKLINHMDPFTVLTGTGTYLRVPPHCAVETK